MRKVTFLLIAALAVASTSGCGKMRSWCHRGSPCGTTTVAPAVLGAPIAVSAPIAAPAATAPIVAAPAPAIVGGGCGCCTPAPCCPTPCPTPCVPCQTPCTPCCETPCGDGWMAGSSGYFQSQGACSSCADGAPVAGYDYVDATGGAVEVDRGADTTDPGPAGEN